MTIFGKLAQNIEARKTIKQASSEKWHALNVEEVLTKLASSHQGISHEMAEKKLREFGCNELPQSEREPAWKLFLRQFNSPLMYIMMLAIGVSYFTGNRSDTIFIAVVALSNVFVGFYQEHKANRSLESLKSLLKTKSRIIRAGLEQEIETTLIVPGDIIILRAGDKVPADARIIENHSLKTNEASLTGESKPVEKHTQPVKEQAEPGDRLDMVFMGTLIEEGSAEAVVVETGVKTEYGDIVKMLGETAEEQTPLQKTIRSLSKVVGIFITCVVGLISLEGYILSRPLEEVFATSLALFVSAIPEGLLPAITIVLTIGMRRILKYKGLVRRLAATETLGGVTVICTDKTGTLTEGKMAVSRIFATNGDERNALRLALLPIDAFIENEKEGIEKMIFRGRPTEQALLKAGVEAGLLKSDLEAEYKELGTIFFSSEKKYSASLRETPQGAVELYVVGAPERILERVGSIITQDGIKNTESHELTFAKEELMSMISQGFRVVACAYKTFEQNKKPENLEEEVENLTLAGLIALDDPVRKDVAIAFEQTRKAGIRTIIITGDHKATAQKVGEKVGFSISEDEIIEGHLLETISDSELLEKLKTAKLFARVSPRHKLRIVKLLQSQGEVVAMFGDGVNDAPALKASDIGVAVESQVDATREVADIVLLDGSFATIVRAIEQGRIIFNNIRRIFVYLITQDFSQFILFFFAIATRLPLPFLPAQLLLVNLVESGLPDIALTTEQERDGVMNKPPRSPKESIVNRQVKFWMIGVLLTNTLIATSLYYFLYSYTPLDIAMIRSMMTAFFCMEALFLALSLRSFSKPLLRRSLFDNKWLTGAVAISFVGLLIAIYFEPIANPIKLLPIPSSLWLFFIPINILTILIIDHLKLKFLK